MTVTPCFPSDPPARRESDEVAGPSRLRRAGTGHGPRSRSQAAQLSGHDPDLWLYRERTLGILSRYQRLSVRRDDCRLYWVESLPNPGYVITRSRVLPKPGYVISRRDIRRRGDLCT